MAEIIVYIILIGMAGAVLYIVTRDMNEIKNIVDAHREEAKQLTDLHSHTDYRLDSLERSHSEHFDLLTEEIKKMREQNTLEHEENGKQFQTKFKSLNKRINQLQELVTKIIKPK